MHKIIRKGKEYQVFDIDFRSNKLYVWRTGEGLVTIDFSEWDGVIIAGQGAKNLTVKKENAN